MNQRSGRHQRALIRLETALPKEGVGRVPPHLVARCTADALHSMNGGINTRLRDVREGGWHAEVLRRVDHQSTSPQELDPKKLAQRLHMSANSGSYWCPRPPATTSKLSQHQRCGGVAAIAATRRTEALLTFLRLRVTRQHAACTERVQHEEPGKTRCSQQEMAESLNPTAG